MPRETRTRFLFAWGETRCCYLTRFLKSGADFAGVKPYQYNQTTSRLWHSKNCSASEIVNIFDSIVQSVTYSLNLAITLSSDTVL